MACTLNIVAPETVCNGAGGITHIKMGADAASAVEYSPNSEHSSVEEKYTFDRTTGIGYYITTLSIDLGGYNSNNAESAQLLSVNDEIPYIEWTTENGVTSTYTSGPGQYAYVTETNFATGAKMEDGSSMKMTVTIKSSAMITNHTTTP